MSIHLIATHYSSVQWIYDSGAEALKCCSRMDAFEVTNASLEYHLLLYFEFLSFKLIARFLQFTFSILTPFFMPALHRAFSSHLILSYSKISDLLERFDDDDGDGDGGDDHRLSSCCCSCSCSCCRLTDPSPHRQLEPVLFQGRPMTLQAHSLHHSRDRLQFLPLLNQKAP